MPQAPQPQPQNPQAQQQQQKPPQKDKPLSFPVISMVVGGAMVFFPWTMGMGNFLTKLVISVLGLGLAALGYWKSK